MTSQSRKQFLKLLKYSNNLKKQNRYLIKEDSKSFNELLKFLSIIERNLHYSEKLEYINLINDFLNNEITVENFSDSFIAIYEGINKKLNQMQIDESFELLNFLNKNDQSHHESHDLILRIYGACDSFGLENDSEISAQKELKDYCKSLLLKLEYETNDSFFQPEIDVDQLIRKNYLIFILITLGFLINLVVPILS